MYIPNRFVPRADETPAVRQTDPDVGRQVSYDAHGLTSTARAYPAEAETQIAPFLADNIAKDRQKRNYFIAPGGAQVFKEEVVTEAVDVIEPVR